MFVFGESGGEGLREGHEPRWPMLHKALEFAGVKFIDATGGDREHVWASRKCKRMKNDPCANATYKTNPFKGAVSPKLPASTVHRVPDHLDARHGRKRNLFMS